MKLKGKILGLAAAALMTLGVGGSAFAADSGNVSLEITPGTQFSVTLDSASNFHTQPFTLGDASPQYSTAYYYTVTDLRGSGKGWTVKASTDGFKDTDGNVVPNQELHSTNLPWPHGDGVMSAEPNSIRAGIGGYSNWTNIIGAGGQLLAAQPGKPNDIPNGTGVFHSGDALFLKMPFGVAAGTYTATIQLTLATVQP